MARIVQTYPTFTDPRAAVGEVRPVSNGFIHVGKLRLDPTNPDNKLDVFYFDRNGTQVATENPVRTNTQGATVDKNGNIISVFTELDSYSIYIVDGNGSRVYSGDHDASLNVPALPYYDVGDVMLTTNKVNPALRGFIGSWKALTTESVLNVVNPASTKVGTVTGNDTVDVPLVKHGHEVTVDPHEEQDITSSTPIVKKIGTPSSDPDENILVALNDNLTTTTQEGSTARNVPSHTHQTIVPEQEHVVTVEDAGEYAKPTINVKGQVYNLIGWIRTA